MFPTEIQLRIACHPEPPTGWKWIRPLCLRLLMAFTGPDDVNCNVARRVGAWSPEEFVSNVKAFLKGRTEGNT